MSESLHSNDPYGLLKRYLYESKILSLAFGMRERKFRKLDHLLTYPLVILTSCNTIFAGFDMNRYIVLSISLISLILIGFNQAVQPKDKEYSANIIKNEFSELNQSITQFVQENNKTDTEIKQYSQVIFEQLRIWKSLAPPISDSYIKKAKASIVERVRVHSIPHLSISDSEKKKILTDAKDTTTQSLIIENV